MWLVNETVGSFHRAEHGAMSAILKTLGGAIFLLTKCSIVVCNFASILNLYLDFYGY